MSRLGAWSGRQCAADGDVQTFKEQLPLVSCSGSELVIAFYVPQSLALLPTFFRKAPALMLKHIAVIPPSIK